MHLSFLLDIKKPFANIEMNSSLNESYLLHF